MSFTLKSSQTIAVVAIAAALVAGAYAVGRSQNASLSAPVSEASTSTEVAPVEKTVVQAPSKVEPRAPVAPPASNRLCERCLRVVSVQAVSRQGEGSGLGAIGGAVIGGYAGNEIEKRNRSTTAWVVTTSDVNGHRRTHEQARKPDLQSGDIVVLQDGELQRR